MRISATTSAAILSLLASTPSAVQADPLTVRPAAPLAEIAVTAQRRPQPRLLHAGNVAVLDAATIGEVRHQHIHELLNRVPGVWIVRGSGQEHQTAIRSPVLGGGGSCGGFLILEDGIPIRPANFCNGNQLIEVDAEQASAVEVIRGPVNALHGSNALHGVVNVRMPMPGESTGELGLEGGSHGFLRARASLPLDVDSSWLASLNIARDDGHRDDSGYRQGKLHLKRRWSSTNGDLFVAMTATGLDQDNAGFITGRDAYENRALSRTNTSPGAFRDASSLRLYGGWSQSHGRATLDVWPYLRSSRMEFMHHELPGRPIEENGHVSAGLLSTVHVDNGDWTLAAGADLEWSDAFLRQEQTQAATGPPRVVATRPVGRHYDYEVRSLSAAMFLQATVRLNHALQLGGGIRAEHLHDDYHNRMLAGNTRDDGTPCGFGGCFYSRPASRHDNFGNLAPNLSAVLSLSPTASLYASLARGFRVPQALELYRLQNGQLLADLKSERSDGAELGFRVSRPDLSLDAAAFWIRKSNSVFRDSDGFNVTGARSRHRGVEVGAQWRFAPSWQLDASASYARHLYDFDFAGPGQVFRSGSDVDQAPRLLGSLAVATDVTADLRIGLYAQGVGSYYLDPANLFRYDGHVVAGLRGAYRLGPRLRVAFRVNNLFDERYADRADHGAGDYRYLPGREREFFLELRYPAN